MLNIGWELTCIETWQIQKNIYHNYVPIQSFLLILKHLRLDYMLMQKGFTFLPNFFL